MTGRPIVVDASVAVKWFIEEERAELAAAFLARAAEVGDRLVGPPLLPVEVTNAIYQRFRRGDATADEADAAIAHYFRNPIEVLTPSHLVTRSYAFARDRRLKNIYDCLYVVLARELDTEFWTDDLRLYDAVASVAPWVRWLGDYASAPPAEANG